VAHSHPKGAVVTYPDLNTTRAQAPEVGGVRTHLVARGGNRWSILEAPGQGGPGLQTDLDLAKGIVEKTMELEAPGVKSDLPTPHIFETTQKLNQPSSIRSLGELAEALDGPTPLGARLLETAGGAGRAASALPATEAVADEVKAAGEVTAVDKLWAYGLRGLKFLGRLVTLYGPPPRRTGATRPPHPASSTRRRTTSRPSSARSWRARSTTRSWPSIQQSGSRL
jgi:hypothetical protein